MKHWIVVLMPDGRFAWLLSARKDEWALLDETRHKRQEWAIQRLNVLLMLIALILGLLAWWRLPWFKDEALLFPFLLSPVPLCEALWRRRLAAGNERRRGGVLVPNSVLKPLRQALWIMASALALMLPLLCWKELHRGEVRWGVLILVVMTLWMLASSIAEYHRLRRLRPAV